MAETKSDEIRKTGPVDPARIPAPRDFFNRARLRLFAIIFALSVLIGLIVSQNSVGASTVLREGTFARKSVRAPYDFEIVDEDATEDKRLEAISSTPVVLDFDPSVLDEAKLRILSAFAKAQGAVMADGDSEKNLDEAADTLLASIGVALSDQALTLLKTRRFDQSIANATTKLLDLVGGRIVLDNRADFEAARVTRGDEKPTTPPPPILRDTVTGNESIVREPDSIVGMIEARQFIDEKAPSVVKNADPDTVTLVAALAKSQLRSNAKVNKDLMAERRAQAAREVVPVKLVYKKNQLIVGEGRSVTAEHAMVMRWLAKQETRKTAIPRLLGISILLTFLIFFSFYITDINMPEFRVMDTDFAFLGSLLLVSLALLRLMLFLGSVIAEQSPVLPPSFMLFLFPAAFAPMLVRFVQRFETALIFAVCLSLVGSLVTQLEIPISIYFFISGLVGAHSIGKAHRRVDVLRAGITTGLLNIAMLGCFLLLGFWTESIPWLFVGAFLGGVFSAFFVVAATPLVELAFGYMTPVSLLELANYEHPLLRQIMTKTPGTFQHSVTIGSLAEAAAEQIGADALLCRVGALFHDAGKSTNADWFVENQSTQNPHDLVADPYRSADIIKRHVADGVELARQHHIGERIIDFVREHHGTGKIAYFLNKAIEQAGGDISQVDVSRFTYEGPRPRSKETGIMIIADAVEATSRAMRDRSPEAIRTMIDKTITRILDAGQLDECPLTQSDLTKIAESFARVLSGIHVNRIEYRGTTMNYDAKAAPS